MSEWWTYSLSDFLLFSPRTYYRLIELYNQALWPAQLLWLAVGAGIFLLHSRGGAAAARLAAALLAAAWLWVALAFHSPHFATINWAAEHYAAAFIAQGVLLLWFGTLGGRLAGAPAGQVRVRAGRLLALLALVAYPLLAPLLGRPWTQAEVFGATSDATALATLGIVLASRRPSWPLLAIPLAWCALSGATQWAMKAPEAPLLPVLALVAGGFAVAARTAPQDD